MGIRLVDGAAAPPDDPHVLVVDDDPDLLRALGRMLAKRGVPSIEVARPGLALEVLARRRISVVVCDLDLPETDGLKLLADIGERWPNVKRILWTGHATADLILEARGCRVLSKSLSPSLVVDTVVRIHRRFGE